MTHRHSELIALGPELCEEAQRSGAGVNEAHLLVHRLFVEIFQENVDDMPAASLRTEMASRLRQSLQARA